MKNDDPSSNLLPWKLRSDLQWTSIHGERRSWWIATDLMRSRHFRCGEEEKSILSWLDGRQSIDSLLALFRQQFPHQTISRSNLLQIVSSAAQSGLLASIDQTSSVNASAHAKIQAKKKSQDTVSGIYKILNRIESWPWNWIQSRISFGNPDWIARAIGARTGWLFSKLAVQFWLIFILGSLLVVLNRTIAEASHWKWPSLQEWISQGGTFAAILLITRILHEIGHAAVAARYGACCHEGGIIFMFGVVCPFVDVTDSWRLPKKSSRMAVAAAGVYAECILASIAGLVWCETQSGFLHDIAWQIALTCSMMTLLVNANPLMRYDGYFVLCDFMESANLRDEAQKAWVRFLTLRHWNPFSVVGKSGPSARDIGLVLFAALQLIYRSTVVTTIALSVFIFMVEWQLRWAGIVFASLVFVSFVLVPVLRIMIQSFHATSSEVDSRRQWHSRVKLGGAWAAAVLMLGAVVCSPLPNRIACTGIVEPKDRAIVYTRASGKIASVNVRNLSDSVLENWSLKDQHLQVLQKRTELEARLTIAKKIAFVDSVWMNQIGSLTTLLSIAEKKVEEASKRLQSLSILDQFIDGIEPGNDHSQIPSGSHWVPIELPQPMTVSTSEAGHDSSPSLGKNHTAGYTIHDDENAGRWLQEGTPVGYVVHDNHVQIWALLDESKLSLVKAGMEANVILKQRPTKIYRATVSKVSELSSLALLGTDSIQGNQLLNLQNAERQMQSNSNGDARQDAKYYVVLDVDALTIDSLAPGGVAEVVIRTRPVSIASHLSRIFK